MTLQPAAHMQTYHIMRVVLSGTTPQHHMEQFSTIVRVSSDELSTSAHLHEARFRAGVRGLKSPWRIDAEYEIARTYREDTARCVAMNVGDMDSVVSVDVRHESGRVKQAWAA